MKKVTFLLATLLIGGLLLTGCKKPEPTPDPEPTTFSVVYKVDNTYDNWVMSDCFKLNVTYTDANGQSVTENNVTLPWTKTIEVTSPFKAKMEGTFVYNVEELPDHVVLVRSYAINEDSHESGSSTTKEKFLELVELHPEQLLFSIEKDL